MVIRSARPVCVRYSRRISNSLNKPALARSKTRKNSSPSTWAAALRPPWPWFGVGSKRDGESSVHTRCCWSLRIGGARSEEEREVVRALIGIEKGIRIRKRRCYRQRQRHDRAVQRQT